MYIYIYACMYVCIYIYIYVCMSPCSGGPQESPGPFRGTPIASWPCLPQEVGFRRLGSGGWPAPGRVPCMLLVCVPV